MKRIKELKKKKKGILAVMAIMALVFASVYSKTISRVGFEYMDTILVPAQENGGTVYSGKIRGQQAQFTVSKDKTVVFRHGDNSYGPYTAKKDPAAIPQDSEMVSSMTGVELRQGETILFRGGVLKTEDIYWLYNEDGTPSNLGFSYVSSDGTKRDANGNEIDPMEPSVSTILELMGRPRLTHQGDRLAWFLAVFLCLINAISILFADELFRWNLAFQIRNADQAEPSDWEITGRYHAWTAIPVMALVVFLMGLR